MPIIVKRWRTLFVAAVLAALLAGCGAPGQQGNAEPPGDSGAPDASVEPGSSGSVIEAEEEQRRMEVDIYGSDAELLDLAVRHATVAYEDEADLVRGTIDELQQEFGEEGVSLWTNIQALSTELEDGLLTLDLHIPDEARLGAPGEQLLVDSLRSTLFQFQFVQAIELLVDGEPVESLMGHVGIEHPILK